MYNRTDYATARLKSNCRLGAQLVNEELFKLIEQFKKSGKKEIDSDDLRALSPNHPMAQMYSNQDMPNSPDMFYGASVLLHKRGLELTWNECEDETPYDEIDEDEPHVMYYCLNAIRWE